MTDSRMFVVSTVAASALMVVLFWRLPASAESASGELPAAVVMPVQTEGLADGARKLLDDLLVVALDEQAAYRLVTVADIEAQLGLEQMKDSLGCRFPRALTPLR